MAVSACGGATRSEPPEPLDAAEEIAIVADGGEVPEVETVDDATFPDVEASSAISPDAVDSVDSAVPKLDFGAIGKPVLVRDGFTFPEGPIWDPARQALFFTDIDGDKLYRYEPPSTFDVVLDKTGFANGLAIDNAGRLLVAGFGARNVWRMSGTDIEPIADNFQGLKLNSPDDLVARSDGTIYFTDPTYGIDGTNGPTGKQELDFMGVFRVAPSGALFLEDSTVNNPNGLSLSPDEKTLFVSYTTKSEVIAFDIAQDGSLGGRRSFARGLVIPDGMTIDSGGNVYVAIYSGIAVLAPNGALLGTIPVPLWASNCAFGGADQRTLFITARSAVGNRTGALYRIDDMPIAGVAGQP
jgi:gluconolactonase